MNDDEPICTYFGTSVVVLVLRDDIHITVDNVYFFSPKVCILASKIYIFPTKDIMLHAEDNIYNIWRWISFVLKNINMNGSNILPREEHYN